MANYTIVSAQDLLKNTAASSISVVGNSLQATFDPQYGHNFPIFNVSLVPTIMRDSRVRFGLNLIKAPIENFTIFLEEEAAENGMLHETIREQGIQFPYTVKSTSEEVEKFVLKTLRHFWEKGLRELLSAIEWGFSCCQVLYKTDPETGHITYDSLRRYHPGSVRPLYYDGAPGELAGANIRGIAGAEKGFDLMIPKVIWHVHAPEVNPILGQSRLEWCHVPWHETWVAYGARDIRRTWFHRNSFNGGQMRYPIGFTKQGDQEISNDVLASQVMSNIRAGGYLILPSELDATGKPRWEYIPPDSNITPQGLMEYPEQLRVEILEGLGIPPEVVESSSEGGFGSATGRKVPMVMYYSSLASLVSNAITDVDRFIIQHLVRLNFGKSAHYLIERLIPLKSADPSLPEKGSGTRKSPVETTESDSGMS